MIGLALLITISAFSLCNGENHWALLVAGSNGYFNYRHQADICHAYHVLLNHGFAKERIIVMMYDDIAYNEANPVQGNIINRPDGPNVYEGVVIDYRKYEVNPDTFLKVLTGDEEGLMESLGRKGKVIKSGPNDRIFVNFADHGAPLLIAFPDSVLHAYQLHNAIKSMHKEKKYKEMVIYVEACESGSMFDGFLESSLNVYATTAANTDESSYACYQDDKRGTYLGDVYSVLWMQDSDKENLKTESLDNQFKLVREETNTSHVMRYGDVALGNLKLADFQGNLTSSSNMFMPKRGPHPAVGAVPSEDVHLSILKMKVAKASGDEAIRHRHELNTLLKKKHSTEEFFKNLVALTSKVHLYDFFVSAPVKVRDAECYVEGVRLIQEMCPGMNLPQNDFALRKLRVLANMCESDIPAKKIWAAIGKISYESMLC